MRASVEEIDVDFSNAGTGTGHRRPAAARHADGLQRGGGEVQPHVVIGRSSGNVSPEIRSLICILVLRGADVGASGRKACVLKDGRILHPLYGGLRIAADGAVRRQRRAIGERKAQRNDHYRDRGGCRARSRVGANHSEGEGRSTETETAAPHGDIWRCRGDQCVCLCISFRQNHEERDTVHVVGSGDRSFSLLGKHDCREDSH